MFRAIDRRQFLHRTSLIAMSSSIPLFISRTVRAAEGKGDGRILVIIQLSGGNDGINTLVPFADEGYAKHRHELRLRENQLIKLNDHSGLHPSLRPVAELIEDDRLAIVPGVGYPNPNRSHEVSMAIWQTARMDPLEHNVFGWIGRAMDEVTPGLDGSPHSILIGSDNPPIALHGRRSTAVSLAHLEDLKLRMDSSVFANSSQREGEDLLAFTRRIALDASSTAQLIDQVVTNSAKRASPYPETGLAERLKSIAQLIKSGFSTSVYYAMQPGYDTHAAQLPAHSRLLSELGGALKAFLDDLRNAGLDNRVLTLCFSEFGRRVQENASLGTDHGTAGPVMIAGPSVVAGLVGQAPSLTDLEDGDLKMQTDFRSVYATILQDWLGIASEPVLGGTFDRLDFLRNT